MQNIYNVMFLWSGKMLTAIIVSPYYGDRYGLSPNRAPISLSVGAPYMNGDVAGKLSGSVNFPPTPESPHTDYTAVNGSMDGPGPVQTLYPAGGDPASPTGTSPW